MRHYQDWAAIARAIDADTATFVRRPRCVVCQDEGVVEDEYCSCEAGDAAFREADRDAAERRVAEAEYRLEDR